ncbi:MAG TPA: cation-transporting P-type ATPase, partial [Gaiellaceae bacterium]|nr:cation-transporting P-type ATPase [Gaiellaceae bacterium]
MIDQQSERHVPRTNRPPPTASSPHSSEVRDLARALATDLIGGLEESDAHRRLVEVGANRLPVPDRPQYLAIAARQMADPLVALLLAATAVSVLIGEQLEALVIAAIVVLNAVLGFVQEAGAERAVLALRSAIRPTASVIRAGRERDVPAEDLVPGDLLVLREGDRVSADARFAAGELLELDESALTGESLPVRKASAPVARRTAMAERSSMVFAGTGVTRGGGRGVVVATGRDTEVGRIATLTATARPPLTPLQRRLAQLSRAMVGLGVAVTALLTLGMLARGASLREAFLVGVAVAVAAVPEGLGATVTIALAQGARAMAGRGAIVRRLAAVETLGAATVIAADKTGTLTINQLRVVAVRPEPGCSERDVLEAGVLASTADLIDDEGGIRIAGDPVDGAFMLALAAAGCPDPRSDGRTVVRVVPFDPTRRRLTAVYEEDGRPRLFVKGAPETLIERSCLGARRRRGLLAQATNWASDGLRVLAVGEGVLGSGEVDDEDELDREIEILGLVGLQDPLRPTAADSIRGARAEGVAVAILTGDHPVTAAAVARALELPDGVPLTGLELEALDDAELGRVTQRHSVFARVTPADKLRLVEALQRAGEVVAVTGDGINDTPALRRADVGVAMGGSGTESAREAADVVLTDDDFATMLAAIREGRRIADNIRNFVAFLLSANLGEVVLFAVAIVAGIGAPMTVVQVLTVNLLTDGLPAVALSRDLVSVPSARSRPRGHESLFQRPLQLALALMGIAVGLTATAAYVIGRAVEPDAAQTMAFATLATAELVLVFSIRSGALPAWRAPRNPILVASVLVSVSLLALSIYLPALH